MKAGTALESTQTRESVTASRPGGKPLARLARVLHVITQLELGGAQQNTLYTCGHLDRARYEVFLACGAGGYLDDEAKAIADLETEFIPALIRPVRPHRDLGALLELTSLMRRLRPDLVHTHSSKAGILGRLAARRAGVRTVVHSIHGFGFHAGQPWPVRRAYISAERAAARATTQFIAVSRAGAAEGIALGLFGPERCRVIRSGVETARFAAAARQRGGFRAELGLGPADPLVGMIACLKPQKCPEDFVEVAGRVLADEPRATFVLAGDGELRGAVEARIAAIPGGRQRILLLGWRRDTERILADLDVALLTSRWEGLPRVLPEAMAAGRPVVATAVDGSPEAVEEGVSGFLAPAGGTELLAHRVLELLRDPGLRLRMGAEGARRAGEWDIDAMVRSQEALYDELLSGGPSAA